MISCHRAYRSWLTFAAILLAAGCDDAPEGMGTVIGRVAVDGVPATKGAISFTPSDGMAPTTGGKIVDGRYEATAAIGAAKVMIRIPKVVGERKLYDTPDSPVQPITEESLPPKYNDRTELEIEVHPGEMECNFDLSSK